MAKLTSVSRPCVEPVSACRVSPDYGTTPPRSPRDVGSTPGARRPCPDDSRHADQGISTDRSTADAPLSHTNHSVTADTTAWAQTTGEMKDSLPQNLPCRSGLVVTCLTAVREDPDSNLTAGSCVYHDSHCDIQPWARAAHPYCSA